jgi:hypothetical protein
MFGPSEIRGNAAIAIGAVQAIASFAIIAAWVVATIRRGTLLLP